MRKTTAALLFCLAFNAQAATEGQSTENRPYTFDYFVHVNSGPKPSLIFGTGQTTYIQLPEGVEAQQILVRRGKTQKNAEIFYSAPYTVVKELHDSLTVVTNKGTFTAERSGAKTEVELAAERAESAIKERQAAEAKLKEGEIAAAKAKELAEEARKAREAAQEQAEAALKERTAAEEKAKEQEAELAKLRDELKAQQAIADAKVAQPAAASMGKAQVVLANQIQPAMIEEPSAAAPAATAAPVMSAYEIQIRNGEGLRAALARESEKLGVKLSWSLKEDRVASRDMLFAGMSRDEVLNDILVAFRLPGYLVQTTNTLYIVKD